MQFVIIMHIKCPDKPNQSEKKQTNPQSFRQCHRQLKYLKTD